MNNNTRGMALAIAAQYKLLEYHRNVELRHKEFETYALRLVCKYCADYVKAIDHDKKVLLHKRVSKYKTIRMCKACARSGRLSAHYGLCANCRPTFAPELPRGVLTKKLGIPQQIVDRIPWRRSKAPARKVSLASDVWRRMNKALKTRSRTPRQLKKLGDWIARGEHNFFKEIFANEWRIL